MAKVTVSIGGGKGPKTISKISNEEAIERIIKINTELNEFWSSSKGWAPIKAAELLNNSRLDWQVSLSKCLKLWIKKALSNDSGFLILAWVNLGSLVEGTMKLFLSVHYETYKKDIRVIKKNRNIQNPDCLTLEPLRIFFNEHVWDKATDEKEWNDWILHIQQRRNAIHAYKNRDIGNFDEFFIDVHKYMVFLQNLNDRLPYPI